MFSQSLPNQEKSRLVSQSVSQCEQTLNACQQTSLIYLLATYVVSLYFIFLNINLNFPCENLPLLFSKNINLFIKVIMPIGITYYSFNENAYLADNYHHNTKPIEKVYQLNLFDSSFPLTTAKHLGKLAFRILNPNEGLISHGIVWKQLLAYTKQLSFHFFYYLNKVIHLICISNFYLNNNFRSLNTEENYLIYKLF